MQDKDKQKNADVTRQLEKQLGKYVPPVAISPSTPQLLNTGGWGAYGNSYWSHAAPMPTSWLHGVWTTNDEAWNAGHTWLTSWEEVQECLGLLPKPPDASELGNKLAARLLLSSDSGIIVPSQDEWIGVNLLERDDELPERK